MCELLTSIANLYPPVASATERRSFGDPDEAAGDV